MSANTDDLSIGRIVRYTDPDGQARDAIVTDLRFDGDVTEVGIEIGIALAPETRWVRPESLSIPR